MIDPGKLRDTIQKMITDALPIMYATVSAVGDDGTVNLAFGTSIIEQVPCSSGYPVRAIGDTVLVMRAPSGNWEVMFRSSASEAPEFATVGQLEAATDALTEDYKAGDEDVRGDIKPVPQITWGTGAPSDPSWRPAAGVYFRDTGSGGRDIYFDEAVAAPPPTTAPPKPTKPPAQTAPKSITIEPSSRGSWRASGQTESDVLQGTWTNLGNWLGGWFYGDAIEEACQGRSVKSMVLRLARAGGGTGWNRGVPVHLGLHDRKTKGKPPKSEGPRTPFKLEPNQARNYTLPGAWRDMLASGAMRGFFVTGSGDADYMKFTGSAGRLVINFNAS